MSNINVAIGHATKVEQIQKLITVTRETKTPETVTVTMPIETAMLLAAMFGHTNKEYAGALKYDLYSQLSKAGLTVRETYHVIKGNINFIQGGLEYVLSEAERFKEDHKTQQEIS